jgi:hypothetical protein
MKPNTVPTGQSVLQKVRPLRQAKKPTLTKVMSAITVDKTLRE